MECECMQKRTIVKGTGYCQVCLSERAMYGVSTADIMHAHLADFAASQDNDVNPPPHNSQSNPVGEPIRQQPITWNAPPLRRKRGE